MKRLRLLVSMMACLVLLAACKTQLYTNLTEQEANDMLQVLLSDGVAANKGDMGEGIFNITVSDEDVGRALKMLDMHGLPRKSRESIGQVFAKSGIVSSPFEERVRYVFALGEEVSNTLQQIDGVMVARVHIVMPEEPGLGREAKPSSAAVFIKQQAGFDLDFRVPQIRRLVANSIEGVKYEEVSVVLVDGQQPLVSASDRKVDLQEPLPGLRVSSATVPIVWTMVAALAFLCCVIIAMAVYFLRRISALKAAGDEDADALT